MVIDFVLKEKEAYKLGRKEGAITELKANLHLLDDFEGMNFSANWYRRQIELRIKELGGETK